MARFAAGDILVRHCHSDSLPKEANTVRPCVIVEDTNRVSDGHANVIVGPLTTSASTVIVQLSVYLPPTPDNGLARISFAPAYMVTAASKQRIDRDPIGRITPTQLQSLRVYIPESLGLS